VEAIQLVNAQLQAGPPTVGDGSVFPSGQTNIPLDLNPTPQKPYAVSTGRQLANVSSPNSLQTLPGIGTGSTVTQGHTLYMRTNGSFLVALTMNGIAGGAVQEFQLAGLVVLEFDQNKYLTLLQVQGTGTIEYLVVGNQ
jgi:hypothetical protein